MSMPKIQLLVFAAVFSTLLTALREMPCYAQSFISKSGPPTSTAEADAEPSNLAPGKYPDLDAYLQNIAQKAKTSWVNPRPKDTDPPVMVSSLVIISQSGRADIAMTDAGNAAEAQALKKVINGAFTSLTPLPSCVTGPLSALLTCVGKSVSITFTFEDKDNKKLRRKTDS
ncbi:MAG TPA: hypothetical protein V6D17_04105 [Candidatus Obscuribacterales bacterium]